MARGPLGPPGAPWARQDRPAATELHHHPRLHRQPLADDLRRLHPEEAVTAHVHVMPRELQARRDRLTAALATLADVLEGEDAWIIGPEHLEPLDALDARL